MTKRILALMIACVLVVAMVVPAVAADSPAAFENTYVNTGNQREDLIGVAMTQVGYTEGPNNDTKYGDWYGLPNQAWCAMFISWCADQADISTKILQKSAWASPRYDKGFGLPCYSGKEYTPIPGDLFFTDKFEHVGIVYAVEGEYILTIEANTNDDGGSEGYYCMLRKRKIEENYFGVPAYKGCDKDHTYVRGCDEAHPHASYYSCTTCGDKYYTGSYAHLTSCSSCMSCNCSVSAAGYYRVTAQDTRLRVRSGHGSNYERVGYLEAGETVYVVAAGSEWAHIIYANSAGYVSMEYLEKFVPTPGNVLSDQPSYYKNDTAVISWEPVSTAIDYTVTVLQNGSQIQSTNMGNATSVELAALQPGKYEVQVVAGDGTLRSQAASCSFNVLDIYTVSYDAGGGTGAPQTQQKYEDQELTLDSAVPVREGYVFLGWSSTATANCAAYQPGDVWTVNQDTTLHAVWRSETAAPAGLGIHTPPDKTIYMTDQKLDTTGLVLKITYDDGSARFTSTGFSAEGFSSETPGKVTVTLVLEGLSTSYSVDIFEYIPGDIDLNFVVDKEDVMQLLWHVSFPELYPINVPADFAEDGVVDKEDVIQLLWHVSFPEIYPLM